MKRLIFRYLNENYELHKYTIRNIHDGRIKASKPLMKDLIKVFFLKEKELKRYFKSWCMSKRKKFQFKQYWNTKEVMLTGFSGFSGYTSISGVTYTVTNTMDRPREPEPERKAVNYFAVTGFTGVINNQILQD